jgi:hypothetical protein
MAKKDVSMVRKAALVLAASLIGASIAHAAPERPVEQPDEAGVVTVENRWSEAFVTGDAATLDTILDPDYVSVGTSGAARPKAEIISLAAEYATKNPGAHGTPLPPTSVVSIIGNAALVVHHGATDTSVDVFHFDGGHWRAWYSQHTALPPPK